MVVKEFREFREFREFKEFREKLLTTQFCILHFAFPPAHPIKHRRCESYLILSNPIIVAP